MDKFGRVKLLSKLNNIAPSQVQQSLVIPVEAKLNLVQ